MSAGRSPDFRIHRRRAPSQTRNRSLDHSRPVVIARSVPGHSGGGRAGFSPASLGQTECKELEEAGPYAGPAAKTRAAVSVSQADEKGILAPAHGGECRVRGKKLVGTPFPIVDDGPSPQPSPAGRGGGSPAPIRFPPWLRTSRSISTACAASDFPRWCWPTARRPSRSRRSAGSFRGRTTCWSRGCSPGRGTSSRASRCPDGPTTTPAPEHCTFPSANR